MVSVKVKNERTCLAGNLSLGLELGWAEGPGPLELLDLLDLLAVGAGAPVPAPTTHTRHSKTRAQGHVTKMMIFFIIYLYILRGRNTTTNKTNRN